MAKTTVSPRHAISHNVAAKTGANVRSVQKVMDGGTVRGKIGQAIQQQLGKVKATPPPKPAARSAAKAKK